MVRKATPGTTRIERQQRKVLDTDLGLEVVVDDERKPEGNVKAEFEMDRRMGDQSIVGAETVGIHRLMLYTNLADDIEHRLIDRIAVFIPWTLVDGANTTERSETPVCVFWTLGYGVYLVGEEDLDKQNTPLEETPHNLPLQFVMTHNSESGDNLQVTSP
ncbi:hypothetical protein BDN72DRAFT_858480 [Pluteus cervinus]|uniref:Uncharacterized protein n=1 Tax=Pluteus cervinus TaxID=181527 RepID=A0ACD3AR01_9AGAR|nr:hypothetical protein BDN72DRAFT_858480 [Pluteus cervinus]